MVQMRPGTSNEEREIIVFRVRLHPRHSPLCSLKEILKYNLLENNFTQHVCRFATQKI